MYKEIDELIEAISEDDVFLHYRECEHKLYDSHLESLLQKHQMLQEDYLKMKKYEQYASFDELKNDLRQVKNELIQNPLIQDYYQSYYALNDLLDEVTYIVFHDISDELQFNKWKEDI